ncbi:glycoside hydrolase family 99-like domain-containing protein [Algoriphagus halophytocola]|uniref:glycoside hydrolase family 99-like domain-containing protein n=1 Tax=Algoriphagus halophytocola TaxID=2991499 RepID=UPI0022DD03F4|nr:glycoside hydrolase family 99-like domain-containing protein [Algoriphagus sp. TR-M9]WBL44591.1 glycoside hydrolase family 99-like domain-containing protein [Algoriphagus sp. TR-M9]
MYKSVLYSLITVLVVTSLVLIFSEGSSKNLNLNPVNSFETEDKNTLPDQQNTKKEQVGVFYMPSWNTSTDPAVDTDSFWSCLMGREECSSIHNPAIWGPKGRIYNAKYPYEGPFLERKPIKELKGFYKRDDPEVIRKQLEYMKDYGIDFFAYDWFYGRHYYYHLNFGPQSKIYYPKGWKSDPNISGRVAVPGMEEWGDQLQVLLKVNASLPKEEQLKWAINWCDDSHEKWMLWLGIGSPDARARKANYEGEYPDKALYLKVHEKITRLWIDQYFNRADYLTDPNGRPVVYFYFPQDAESRGAFYGLKLKDLLDLSQATAKKAGFPGIKFIAVSSGAMLERERMYGLPTVWKAYDPNKPWEGGEYQNRQLLQEYVPRLKSMGFEGMTAYVYHNFLEKDNKSYADMRETYKGHWNMWSEKFKNDPNFEYQVPAAMGWDMRPAGGTWPQPSGFPSEPQKDQVHSTKSSFTAMLLDAQQTSRKYRSSNGNTVMICCWNEYLEGNYIEPTEGHGFDYLEAIRDVFEK